MIGRLRELELRCNALQARTGELRANITRCCEDVAARLSIVDSLTAVVRRAASRPLMVGAAAALVILVSRGRFFGWLTKAVMLAGTVRRAVSLLQTIKNH